MVNIILKKTLNKTLTTKSNTTNMNLTPCFPCTNGVRFLKCVYDVKNLFTSLIV